MVVHQGDIYWVDLPAPEGSGPGFRRPCVVVQSDTFNASRIATVVVCILTTSLQRAEAPGNVLLGEGEAGLSKRSVVNVTQIYTIDKARLGEYVGTLERRRVSRILDGIRLVLQPAV